MLGILQISGSSIYGTTTTSYQTLLWTVYLETLNETCNEPGEVVVAAPLQLRRCLKPYRETVSPQIACLPANAVQTPMMRAS